MIQQKRKTASIILFIISFLLFGKTSFVFAQESVITIDAGKVLNKISPLMYGTNIEDVNHEIYGGFYDQRIFGESFEEPPTGVNFNHWRKYAGYWTAHEGVFSIIPGRNSTSEVVMSGSHQLGVEPDQSAKLIYDPLTMVDGSIETQIRFSGKGESGGLLVRVSDPGVGDDVFDGYEISLTRDGKKVILGKHRHDFQLLKEAGVDVNPESWNTLKVELKGSRILVSLNARQILDFDDQKNTFSSGKFCLRTWKSALEFRGIKVFQNGKLTQPKLTNDLDENISYNWDIVKSGPVKASFETDSLTVYNGKRAQVINNLSGNGKVGIANRGLNRWGIAVRKNQVFQGRLYLKAENLEGPVTVALENEDGSKTYASKKLTKITADWTKYPFELTANGADKNARLAIYFSVKGKLWVDQVVLMSTGKDQYHGLPIRADIAEKMIAEGVTFMRYAGTMVNAPDYKFKNMIGDPDKRPPYRGHWNHYSTNGFGIEEFLKFCEKAAITACFAINIYETPQDMADMVEYLNGDETTEWGRRRAQNGHPKPYAVKYIEIGNEEVIFNGDNRKAYEEYVSRFNVLYDAMKKKDGSLKFVHSAWWRPESKNMEYVFRALNGKADYWDLHVGGDDPLAGLETDKQIERMKKLFNQWDPSTQMKIAVFEENGSKHGMQRALGHATNLNAIRRHGEFVLTSSPANALQPYLQNDNDWDQGQIFFTNEKVWGMPPFYSQKMQAENHQPLLVKSTVNNALDITATRSEDGKMLVLHVVNTSEAKVQTKLELNDFEGRKKETGVFVLSGALTARNTPLEPEKYKTVKSAVVLSEAKPLYDFPPHSFTILRFER